MLEGTIIENSLKDLEVLTDLEVLKSWEVGDWKLHRVRLTKSQALEFGNYLVAGPWYVHFWKDNKEDVLVVYKNESFWIKFSDQDTWTAAIEFGLASGISKEQLDFLIEQ